MMGNLKTKLDFSTFILLMMAALTLPLSLAAAQTFDQREFTHWLTQTMQQQRIPGVSIAIINDYELTESKGFGTIQAGSKAPVTPTTRFQAGELTQMATATAALQTAQAGLLALHAPVNRFLTDWRMPDNNFSRRRALSVKRILNATSGTNVETLASVEAGANVPTLKQLLDGAKPATNAPVNVIQTPGREYKPTLGSYLVLQQVLQDIHQETFATLLQTQVLTPFEMSHSSITNDARKPSPAEAAKPHSSKGFVIDKGPRIYPDSAARGLWTTPSDIAQLMVAVFKAYAGSPDQPIHPKMAKKLLNANVKNRQPTIPDTSLGLIANVDAQGNKKTRGPYVMLLGKTRGYQALFIGNKNTGNGAVVMINKAMARAQDKPDVLFDIVAQIAKHEAWRDAAPARHR